MIMIRSPVLNSLYYIAQAVKKRREMVQEIKREVETASRLWVRMS